jgi:hypothetical protein
MLAFNAVLNNTDIPSSKVLANLRNFMRSLRYSIGLFLGISGCVLFKNCAYTVFNPVR